MIQIHVAKDLEIFISQILGRKPISGKRTNSKKKKKLPTASVLTLTRSGILCNQKYGC